MSSFVLPSFPLQIFFEIYSCINSLFFLLLSGISHCANIQYNARFALSILSLIDIWFVSNFC